jgi:hypothetical protein
VFPRGPKIIINPAEDELMKAFGKSRHLMFPFQSVQLIEELAEEDPPAVKIRPFSVIDASEKFTARGNKDGDG